VLFEAVEMVAFDWECNLRLHAGGYADVCGYFALVAVLGRGGHLMAYFWFSSAEHSSAESTYLISDLGTYLRA
jgi:hypothetical protein